MYISRRSNETTTSKASKTSSKQFSKTQQSLTQKIIECNMRKNNQEYQQMLIKQKQLELVLFEQQTKNKNYLKRFEKEKQKLQVLNQRLKSAQDDNQKQQTYLREYYKFLDNKLKTGAKPILLYATLLKVDGDFTKNYDEERKTLEKGILSLKEQSVRLGEQLEKLDYKNQLLNQELQVVIIQKQAERSQLQRKKIADKKRKAQYLKTIQLYKSSIQQLKQQKSELQKEQIMLKKVLNIEEMHKKHWLSIENAIRKQFTYQAKEKHYKEANQLQYKMLLPDLQTELNNKKYEKSVLIEEITERKKKVVDIKSILNNSLMRMSRVGSQNTSRNSQV